MLNNNNEINKFNIKPNELPLYLNQQNMQKLTKIKFLERRRMTRFHTKK